VPPELHVVREHGQQALKDLVRRSPGGFSNIGPGRRIGSVDASLAKLGRAAHEWEQIAPRIPVVVQDALDCIPRILALANLVTAEHYAMQGDEAAQCLGVHVSHERHRSARRHTNCGSTTNGAGNTIDVVGVMASLYRSLRPGAWAAAVLPGRFLQLSQPEIVRRHHRSAVAQPQHDVFLASAAARATPAARQRKCRPVKLHHAAGYGTCTPSNRFGSKQSRA